MLKFGMSSVLLFFLACPVALSTSQEVVIGPVSEAPAPIMEIELAPANEHAVSPDLFVVHAQIAQRIAPFPGGEGHIVPEGLMRSLDLAVMQDAAPDKKVKIMVQVMNRQVAILRKRLRVTAQKPHSTVIRYESDALGTYPLLPIELDWATLSRLGSDLTVPRAQKAEILNEFFEHAAPLKAAALAWTPPIETPSSLWDLSYEIERSGREIRRLSTDLSRNRKNSKEARLILKKQGEIFQRLALMRLHSYQLGWMEAHDAAVHFSEAGAFEEALYVINLYRRLALTFFLNDFSAEAQDKFKALETHIRVQAAKRGLQLN